MSKKGSLFVIVVLVFSLLLNSSALATQYNPPWADNYGFYASNDIDTRRASYWAKYYQDIIGYNGYNYTNFSSGSGYLYLPNDAVFSHYWHSGPGITEWRDTDGNKTYLVAGTGGENNTSTVKYLSTYSNNAINDVLFMVFGGCNAATTSPTYGNLLTMARNKGIDSIMGFSQTTDWPTSYSDDYGNYFFREFWSLSRSYSVGFSASTAANRYYNRYGNHGGFNSYVFDGAGSDGGMTQPAGVVISPARYGNL
jgi:hypothetical protein